MAQLVTRIVLRNDSTVNWNATSDAVLLRGELGIEFQEDGKAKAKIGDGATTWEALPYFGGDEGYVFEAELGSDETKEQAIERVVGGVTLTTGDIAVVKSLIFGDLYDYTAYVYNGTAWAAMSGNYNAENVYFNEDFVFTKAVGTVTIPNSGSATVSAAGKNLKEFFTGLFAAEQDPTKTDPSVSVALSGSGSYEVGTTFTPSFTATFEDGAYTYGPEPTGATVEKWTVTSTSGETWDTSSGTCAELTVLDDTKYSVTVSVTHTAGSVPKTNVGNECEDDTKRIAAGTKTKTSAAVTGYRSFFYGVLDTSTVDAPLTSAIIRDNLTNGGKYGAAKSFTLNGSATAKRFVIAVPASSTRSGLKEVILTSAMNTPVTDSYTLTEDAVAVEGANGAEAVSYDVWVYEPASIDAGEVHAVTLG